MIDVTQDIHSMTTFKRNSAEMMKRMKKTGRPLVLTVKGKAEAVVLDAARIGKWLIVGCDSQHPPWCGASQERPGPSRRRGFRWTGTRVLSTSPMRYRVIVTPEAETDLRNAASYIRGTILARRAHG